MLNAKLTWSKSIEVSKLKTDLILLGKGSLTSKQFSEKHPMLDNWGIYMYFLDNKKIAYIGETITATRVAFRNEIRRQIVPPEATFRKNVNEKLSIYGKELDSLEIKVGIIDSWLMNDERLIIDGNEVSTITESKLRKIETALTCATDPLYNPHNPAHAKEDFLIQNSGYPTPLLESYKMKKDEKCQCDTIRVKKDFENPIISET
jgi:hypothetical protein